MKALSAKQTIKILQNNGFVLVRQRGSHYIYRQKDSGTMVPVPLHKKNKAIPLGTFLAIVKQSNIPKENFQ